MLLKSYPLFCHWIQSLSVSFIPQSTWIQFTSSVSCEPVLRITKSQNIWVQIVCRGLHPPSRQLLDDSIANQKPPPEDKSAKTYTLYSKRTIDAFQFILDARKGNCKFNVVVVFRHLCGLLYGRGNNFSVIRSFITIDRENLFKKFLEYLSMGLSYI